MWRFHWISATFLNLWSFHKFFHKDLNWTFIRGNEIANTCTAEQLSSYEFMRQKGRQNGNYEYVFDLLSNLLRKRGHDLNLLEYHVSIDELDQANLKGVDDHWSITKLLEMKRALCCISPSSSIDKELHTSTVEKSIPNMSICQDKASCSKF